MNRLAVVGIGIVAFIMMVGIIQGFSNQPTLTREQTETEYLIGCQEGLANEYKGTTLGNSYCECTFDYLYNTLGAKGFENMTVEYQETGVMPESLQNSIVTCTPSN